MTFPPLSQLSKDELAKDFTRAEIWGALRAMSPHKAPGPDGFHAVFFPQNWSLVKDQVCVTVLNILNTGFFEQGISDAIMVLILKSIN